MASDKVTITIPWKSGTNSWNEQFQASQLGIEIKNWLIAEGLVMYVDFEWRVNTMLRTIDITFLRESTYSTLVALKFQG